MDIKIRDTNIKYRVCKKTYEGKKVINSEEVDIESTFSFNTLLEEVKQYNLDSKNKESNRYMAIEAINYIINI